MPELKVVKKKKGLRLGGGDTSEAIGGSSLRPRYMPKDPPCAISCPIGTKIREYMTMIKDGESLERVWEHVTDYNPLPGVTGRVCPHPCEGGCNREQVDGSVGVNDIERFIGTYGIEHKLQHKKISDQNFSEKIAVIGSGPAGISCAYHLARRGYPVTVFEAKEKTGGMLRYGIPRYRLPDEVIDAEYNSIIKDLGITLKSGVKVGKDISYDDLKKEYKIIYVAIGAQKGSKLNIPGEDALNVLTGVDFLEQISSGKKVDIGNKVCVIGGGDTAIDAARVSKRLGADVTILYRRTINEMPAIKTEIQEAEEEGIHFEFLTAPVAVTKNGDKATGIQCIKMELGAPDASGRARPVPIKGSEFITESTVIIAAVSQIVDFTGLERFKNERGWINVNDHYETTEKDVYAGGDVTQELDIAATAIGLGRKAALAIDNYLRGREEPKEIPLPVISYKQMNLGYYERLPKVKKQLIPAAERINNFKEISYTITEEQLRAEAKRCMSCGQCFSCERCWMFCQYSAVVKPAVKTDPYKFKLEFCIGCKKCAEQCPCGYIDMV